MTKYLVLLAGVVNLVACSQENSSAGDANPPASTIEVSINGLVSDDLFSKGIKHSSCDQDGEFKVQFAELGVSTDAMEARTFVEFTPPELSGNSKISTITGSETTKVIFATNNMGNETWKLVTGDQCYYSADHQKTNRYILITGTLVCPRMVSDQSEISLTINFSCSRSASL